MRELQSFSFLGLRWVYMWYTLDERASSVSISGSKLYLIWVLDESIVGLHAVVRAALTACFHTTFVVNGYEGPIHERICTSGGNAISSSVYRSYR